MSSTELSALDSAGRHYAALLMGTTWVETAVGISIFACWTISCWKFTRRFRLDWWVALLTLLTCCSAQACLTYHADLATGDFDPDSLARLTTQELETMTVEALKYGWLGQIIAIVAINLGKICIVLFLDNVIGNARRARPWVLWMIAITNVVFGLTVLVLLLTICNPSAGLWNVYDESRVCGRERLTQGFAYFAGSWSAFSDIMLALYPAPIIWNLQLRRQTKIGLSILLSLGIVAGACAIVKTYELKLMVDITTVSYDKAPLIATTMAEQWITFIVACIPPSAPLLKLVFSKVWQSTVKSRSTSSPHDRGRNQRQGPMFGVYPMTQFQSLAYAVGDVKDIYALQSNNSKQSIVRDVIDGKGIAVQTNVEIHYDGQREAPPPFSSSLASGSSGNEYGLEVVPLDKL